MLCSFGWVKGFDSSILPDRAGCDIKANYLFLGWKSAVIIIKSMKKSVLLNSLMFIIILQVSARQKYDNIEIIDKKRELWVGSLFLSIKQFLCKTVSCMAEPAGFQGL